MVELLWRDRGRPKAFKTVKELEDKIDAYFEWADNHTKKKIVVVDGKPKLIDAPDPIPYTIERLAWWLDVDRVTLLNYENDENNKKFFSTIKKAKNRILSGKVEGGLKGDTNPAITIFDLKNNYGYEDKKVVDQTNREAKPIDPWDVDDMEPKNKK